MKQLLKPLKHSVSRLLGRVGYSVRKLPPKPRKTSKVTKIMLGGKSIKMHSGNPLCFEYKNYPQLNAHIGSVAALVQRQFPGAWAVDVGANVGDTLAILKGQASMPVICVEGDPICYELLEENAQQFKEVFLVKTFLSDKPGQSKVVLDKAGWNTTLTPVKTESSGQNLQFRTLDEVVQALSRQATIKLLKVDAEGYDMRILRGAASILERHKPVINFELNRYNIEPLGESVGDFFDYLVSLEYLNFILNDPLGGLICSINESNKAIWEDLYRYSYLGRPIYFDVWGFHKTDKNLFDEFLAQRRIGILKS